MDKKVRRLLPKIRKMTWSQKLALMDWLNYWYEAYKEEQKQIYLEWLGEEE